MKKLCFCLLALSSLTPFAFPGEVLNGPDYAPPFAVDHGERVEGELRVSTFLDEANGNRAEESYSLVFGNKRVAVREFSKKKMQTGRDNRLMLFVNDEPVLRFRMAASYATEGNERVDLLEPLDSEVLTADRDERSILWRCPYLLPDGREAEFSYTLQSTGENRVILSWDFGCPAEQLEDFAREGYDLLPLHLFIDVWGDYRGKGLLINDAPVEPAETDVLKENANQWEMLWEGSIGEIDYAPDEPLERIHIESSDGLAGVFREIYRWERVDSIFLFRGKKAKGSIVIDFGQVGDAYTEDPGPIEGHNLWTQDALHLYRSPTRNLFPNPSFEQGMRYWRWWFGGATYERSEVPRYEMDRGNALFGEQAMLVNPVQERTNPLRTFSLPFAKGKSYTVSFFAKAEKPQASVVLAPFSSKSGGKFTRKSFQQFESFKPGTEWRRFSYSFQSDGAPTSFILDVNNRGGKFWLDGIQIERGLEATAFVAPAMEAMLATSDPDNNIEFGEAIDANLILRGDSEGSGNLDVFLRDFYGQTLWQEVFEASVGESILLPLDALELGPGQYYVEVDFDLPDGEAYRDDYRFTLIDSLQGTHATKDLYATIFMARTDRAEDRLDLMERFGFGGSTSYGDGKLSAPMVYELREKYNITGFGHKLFQDSPHLTAEEKKNNHPDHLLAMQLNERIWRNPAEAEAIPMLDRYSDDVLARVEEISERAARESDYVRAWSIGTEEEITFPTLSERGDFDEFAKLQEAFARGIKRGNPDALLLPAGGTSGYGRVRGKDDIEGYLEATQGKVKWDAVAVHPYGSIDGTLGQGDLDEAIQLLSDSMAEYGYGAETPIWLNEGGGQKPAAWGDGPASSYTGGQPSYDQGIQEFLHACKMARQYLIALKYWPRVEIFNTWQHSQNTIVDYNLTPSSFLPAINTLGHLLGDPQFVGDVRPGPGVRGYLFDDAKRGAVAALWCTLDDVERGFVRGPVLRVRFEGEFPELYDLMGRRSELKPSEDGWVDIQLTPAPLFLCGPNHSELGKALKNAEVQSARSNVDIAFQPTLDGYVSAEIENLVAREQQGQLDFDGQVLSFKVPANENEVLVVPDTRITPQAGMMYEWKRDYVLDLSTHEPLDWTWDMDYFYVPKVEGKPDWTEIPSIPITNLFRPVIRMEQMPGGYPGDISASFQVAWDERHFYLRVEAEDDALKVDVPDRYWDSAPARKTQLYLLDGCLEVYFDCAANGRSGNEGYDLDDYRYDFSSGNREGQSGPASVYRFKEVYREYAGGPQFPTKEEAAKGIQAEFERISETRYAYTITFAQKYIAPLRLKAGYRAGFGLFLHDRVDEGVAGRKGLSLATKEGEACDRNPQFWPIMVFADFAGKSAEMPD